MGGAVAVVGVGVVVATAHAEEHQRHAEQDGQGNQQLGQGHGLVRRMGVRPVWRLLAWCESFSSAFLRALPKMVEPKFIGFRVLKLHQVYANEIHMYLVGALVVFIEL